ncbi:MAG: hypothetical protein AAFQ51_09095 [Pseudomonadota bacterium]
MTDFQKLPLLAAVTPDQADSLESEAEVIAANPGDDLFPEFSITDAYWILIEGRWRVTRRVAGVPQEMFEADRRGSWTGGIPVIDAIAPPKAEVLAPSKFLRVPIPLFEELVAANPQIAKRLLEAVNWGSDHIGGLIPSS